MEAEKQTRLNWRQIDKKNDDAKRLSFGERVNFMHLLGEAKRKPNETGDGKKRAPVAA